MIEAFKSLFATFVVFFTAAEKVGKAANHMAGYLEESAKAFEQKAAIEREQAIAKLRAGMPALPAALPAPTQPTQQP